MFAINVPAPARIVTDRIKSLYNNVKYQSLISIVAYFLLGKRSVSELVRTSPFTVSVSSFGRAAQKIKPNRLMRRLRGSILRQLGKRINGDNFVFAIDDTANPKYGSAYGVSKWGSSSGVYTGQKIVCLVLVDVKTKKAYPLGYRIANKESGLTALDLAVDLIKEAIESGFPPLATVTDSWFSSVDLMSKLQDLGCEFVGEVKTNRLVKSNPGPNVKWVKITEAFNGLTRTAVTMQWQNASKDRSSKKKFIAERVVQIKKRKSPLKIISVFNRKNAKDAFAYYLSTSPQQSGARIWLLSRARWAIECVFRTCKQNLSFGRLMCAGEGPSHLAVEMPLFLYATLQLEPGHFGFCSDTSVDLMLAKIRAKANQDSIKYLLNANKPHTDRLKKLQGRISSCYASRKPRDKAAA